MTDRNLKRVSRMDLKLCPRCNVLPNVRVNKHFLKWTCVVHCNTLGCKLYYPIITSGFSKDKVMNRAAAAWNNAVNKF